MSVREQPWLVSRSFDLWWIVGPAWMVSALALIFSKTVNSWPGEMPPWMWVVLVMGVDVSHVYSTLYRTYFRASERAQYYSLLYLIPILCWVAGVIVYSIGGAEWFWRILAYLAVFHFIRQQYGFTMLYSRKDTVRAVWKRRLDTATIYLCTVYPLMYWHGHLPRRFDWFTGSDFVFRIPTGIVWAAGWMTITSLVVFVLSELAVARTEGGGELNIPKVLFVLGTAVSWYVGIVHFNNDVPFTLTNVVSHGVPYMALVWGYGRRAEDRHPSIWRAWYRPQAVPLFVGLLVLFAFLEEGLWDGFIWREHAGVFHWFWALPVIQSDQQLALLVPLLTIPQTTHYVLDAFIWRLRKPSADLTTLLHSKTEEQIHVRELLPV